MRLLDLHANVFAMPEGAVPGPAVRLRGEPRPTLCGDDGGPPRFLETLPVTFEQAQEALARLTGADCEPDGFFLVSGREGGRFWRLNGQLAEHAGRLHRAELHGQASPEVLDAVLRALGWPAARLAFELVREGVTLDEPTARGYALAEPTG